MQHIQLFRALLELSNQHAKNANKAFGQKCDAVGMQQSAKSGAFFNAASLVAETYGFDLRSEQLAWIAEREQHGTGMVQS